MNLKKAIERLTYTISKGNKPNDTDKEALNKIIYDYNENSKAAVRENMLFAKLYALVLKDFAMRYQNIELASKLLNKELATPFSFHIEFLKTTFNSVEMSEYFKNKGVNDPLLHVNNFETYKHLFPSLNAKEFISVLETWDDDNINSHFQLTINQSITCFKNLP